MRIVGPKVLLVVMAVLVLALALAVLWVLRQEGEDAGAAEGEGRSSGAGRSATPVSGAMESGDPSAREERRSARDKSRRFRSAEQRRKLVAAIELARAVRRERRLRGGDRPGTANDDLDGELSKEAVRGAVQAVIEDVKACYDEQLERSPDLGGRIVLNFTIDAEEGVGGVVDQVEVSGESDEPMRLAKQLTDCIVDTIYTLELPPPRGGGTVDVSYPMVMSPGDPDGRQR